MEYYVEPEDEDDFRNFAALELKSNPNITKLSNSKFNAYKKHQEDQFEQRLREEAELKRKVQEREQETSLAAELESAERLKNADRQEKNWNARHQAAASSTPKPKAKTPKNVGKDQPAVDKNQPSVADVFKKKKAGNEKQTGEGKKMRWVQLK